MFLDKFFPQYQSINLTLLEAKQIHTMLNNIYQDILNCRKLIEGQWLYPLQQPITSWDRTRLNILLVELGHTLSIPLLLAIMLCLIIVKPGSMEKFKKII